MIKTNPEADSSLPKGTQGGWVREERQYSGTAEKFIFNPKYLRSTPAKWPVNYILWCH